MTKWLALGAILIGAVALYRQLLMPWHKHQPLTLSEQKRIAFGDQPPKYRRTCEGKRPQWWKQKHKRTA